jgi:hypothetical protein
MIKSRRTGWARHVACMGHKRKGYRIWEGKPKRKVQALRPTRRWKDNIKVDVKGRGWENLFCINMVQDRDRWRTLVNMVMKLPVL